MNILCLFAGQGMQQSNLFEIVQNNQQGLGLAKEYSRLTAINLLQNNLPIADPHYSQLIIGSYQMIFFCMLEPLLMNHQMDFAGYSLGEVSAFLASTHASTATVCEVLSYRTQLMTSLLTQQPDNQYDLLLITGNYELDKITTLCQRYECFIAIVNVRHHLVIGGMVSNLKKLQCALPEYNVTQSRFLDIQLPSHTPLYQDKKGQFHDFLSTLNWDIMHYPLFSPITFSKIYSPAEEQMLLDQELYTTLRWDKVCDLIKEYQYDVIIDLGPGASMTNILKLTRNDSQIITTAQYKSIEGIQKKIQSLC